MLETLPALLSGAPRPGTQGAVPTHMQDWTYTRPRVILISSKVRGPIQLSHGHTQQPGERAGSRTGCMHPTWSPFPEPSSHGQPGVPTGHALGGSARPAEAHLWNPWARLRRMATSRVAAAAGAGMAAMPLLTCGVNNSSGGQTPSQVNGTTRYQSLVLVPVSMTVTCTL